jgi:polar amino acid transport system substrate-binding protein
LLPEVAKEMGVTFQFRFMPWPRCERAVEDLQVWATMPYVPTPEREQKFLFSQPLYAKQTLLFYYSPTNQGYPRTFDSLTELQRYKMGGVRGYYYEALFANAGVMLDLATSEESSFKKLRAGRVDMVPAVESVGWDVIRKTFPAEEQANFRVMETPLAVGHNYLMTARAYPNAEQLLERFNQALAKLRRNGVYQSVAARHGLRVDN